MNDMLGYFSGEESPEIVLKILLDEMEKPIISIQSRCSILSLLLEDALDGENEARIAEEIEKMSSNSTYLRALIQRGRSYLED